LDNREQFLSQFNVLTGHIIEYGSTKSIQITTRLRVIFQSTSLFAQTLTQISNT